FQRAIRGVWRALRISRSRGCGGAYRHATLPTAREPPVRPPVQRQDRRWPPAAAAPGSRAPPPPLAVLRDAAPTADRVPPAAPDRTRCAGTRAPDRVGRRC